MFCRSCGAQCNDADAFCHQCRTPLHLPVSPAPQPMYMMPPPQPLVLPPPRQIAIITTFWLGHVLALLCWIFAIVWWVKAGNLIQLPADAPQEALNQVNTALAPIRGLLTMCGFQFVVTGHVLQVFFFWASEMLKASGAIADKKAPAAEHAMMQ